MVDQVITKQELINAKVDAKTLEDTVNGPPDIKVTSRLGRQYWTLATIDSKVASVVSQADYALVLIQNAQDQIVEIADTAQAQFDVKMADLEGQANSTINEWQAAINTIVVNDGVPALSVSTATGQDQQEINDFGGAKWRSKAVGYKLGATVVLDNGDIVRSTVANNTIDPNVDMTGWVKTNDASQIFDKNGLDQQQINDLTVTPFDFGAIGKGVSTTILDWTVAGAANYRKYVDLASIQIDHPHATSLSDTIDWVALQAFFDYFQVLRQATGLLPANAKFFVNKQVVVDPLPYTRFKGQLNVVSYGIEMESLVEIRREYTHIDHIFVDGMYGTGSTSYALRKVAHGLTVGKPARTNCMGVSCTTIDVRGVRYDGVRLKEWAMFFSALKISSYACGSTKAITANFSNPVHQNTGSNAKTTIDVTVMPPADFETYNEFKVDPLYVIIANRAYRITNIDRVNSRITVTHRLLASQLSGNLNYVFGAAFSTVGGNTAGYEIGRLYAPANGIGFSQGGLYGGTINYFCAEYTDIGIVMGSAEDGAVTYGTKIGGAYFEANTLDLVQNSVNRGALSIDQTTNFQFVKTNNPNDATNVAYTDYLDTIGLNGCSICKNNQLISRVKKAKNQTNADGSFTAVIDSSYNNYAFRGSDRTIALAVNDIEIVRKMALDSTTIALIGETANKAPTSATIRPPTGYTINGVAGDSVFSGLTKPALFIVSLNPTSLNFDVVEVCNARSGSVTYDPPSIAAGATITTTITLAGAVVGDTVIASFNRYNADIEITAAVSAANVVTVKFKNTGAAAVDLASGTLTVKLI